MNLIVTILLLVISVSSFFLYTNPHYKNIDGLKKESAQYETALIKAKEAETIKNNLIAKYNTFSVEELHNLEKLLPDTVDNIRLLLDIYRLASNYSTNVTGITVDPIQKDQASGQPASAKAYGALTIKFHVEMTYDNFKKFLSDIEHNLRVTDINTIAFATGESGVYGYDVSLKTYWLK